MKDVIPIRQIPETGFMLINQIIKIPGKAEPPIIPVSRSTWLAGVKKGIYPKPVKIGRTNAWRADDIKNLVANLGGGL